MRDFAEAEQELISWVDARAWTTGDGPKAIFNDAVVWLLERGVLLPGVTTLARLVAQVRDEATQRLWATLSQGLTPKQREVLERLLDVPDAARVSDLERWRKGPAEPSGRNLERALARVSEITAVGLGAMELDTVVPHRRLVDLVRYGMAAKAPQLRRHPPTRRLARLAATVAYLEAKSIDEVLELFDLLMVTELLGKAEREATKEKVRQHPRLARAYDVVRMLQRDGHPTPLGEAIAFYGRIFKSLHILAYVDEETYRRQIKGVRNLQEGRHSLARHVFHGGKGELRQRYHKGMEDQLGALGLVLNCVVLWNTFYMNAALDQLRALGLPVLDEDVARLSPFVRHHLNVHGKYSFLLPDLLGGLRALGDPDTPDPEAEWRRNQSP